MNEQKPQLNPVLKLVLDLGPLVLFFVANSRPALFVPLLAPILPADIATGERAGIFVATAVFMVAIVAALVVSYALTRHLPVMPLVTAIVVAGVRRAHARPAGRASSSSSSRPSSICCSAACCSAGSRSASRCSSIVFDSVFHLTDEGWRKLTLRWALFFFALAILNEIVWRTQTTDFWVSFKVFGVVPLTFVFARAAISAAHEICRAGGEGGRRVTLYDGGAAASAFSIAGLSALSRLSGVIGPISL